MLALDFRQSPEILGNSMHTKVFEIYKCDASGAASMTTKQCFGNAYVEPVLRFNIENLNSPWGVAKFIRMFSNGEVLKAAKQGKFSGKLKSILSDARAFLFTQRSVISISADARKDLTELYTACEIPCFRNAGAVKIPLMHDLRWDTGAQKVGQTAMGESLECPISTGEKRKEPLLLPPLSESPSGAGAINTSVGTGQNRRVVGSSLPQSERASSTAGKQVLFTKSQNRDEALQGYSTAPDPQKIWLIEDLEAISTESSDESLHCMDHFQTQWFQPVVADTAGFRIFSNDSKRICSLQQVVLGNEASTITTNRYGLNNLNESGTNLEGVINWDRQGGDMVHYDKMNLSSLHDHPAVKSNEHDLERCGRWVRTWFWVPDPCLQCKPGAGAPHAGYCYDAQYRCTLCIPQMTYRHVTESIIVLRLKSGGYVHVLRAPAGQGGDQPRVCV